MKTRVIATCALALTIPSFGADSDGLVAHYKFDGNADDSSANKNNGIVKGATLTTDRFGNANRAYSFDGKSWIEVANSVSLQSVTNTMTFSAWIKPATDCHRFMPVLCKGIAQEQFCFYLVQPWGEKDRVFIMDCHGTGDANSVEILFPIGTLDRHLWYHVAASYDGKMMKVYINGQCVGSTSVKNNFAANASSLYIGMDPPGAVEYLKGALDEIRIYNRTLSDNEIDDICMQESRNR